MRLRYLGILLAVPLLSAAAPAEPVSAPRVVPAQVSPPFGGPMTPGPRSCSPQVQRLLKLQAEGMRQLQRLSRGDGERLCSTLESTDLKGVDKLVDPKALEPLLTPDQRDLLGALGFDLSKVDVSKLMRRLGIDLSQVDLSQLTQQCRQSKGELDRFASSELSRLEREIVRCDERV
jgi:hypothetical protein